LPKRRHANRAGFASTPPLSPPWARSRERFGGRRLEVGLDFLVSDLPIAPPLNPVNAFGVFGQLSQSARLPPAAATYRTEFRHRFSIFGDDDGVAVRRLVNEAGEVCFGFVEIDLPTHTPQDTSP